MPTPDTWVPGAQIQVLVYGPSKVGKTWGAYTFPRPVVFDFDNGIATVRNPAFVKKYGLKTVVFYEQFKEAKMTPHGVVLQHNALDEACRFFDEWMKPAGKWKGFETGRDKFDTWVIDSGTTLSEAAQNKAVIFMGLMKLSKSHEQGVQHGLVVPKLQDYGSERSLVEQFVDMVKGSGKHVVLLCHEKIVTNDDGAVLSIEPLFTGKSSETIPLKFDEVYNLQAKKFGPNMVRTLITEADGLRKVGSRYGVPNGTEWNYESIHKALISIREEQDKMIGTSPAPVPPSGA